MLRDLDLNRQNCNPQLDEPNINKIPLTNEHGDVFLRHNDYDDCGPASAEGGYEDFPPNQQYYNNQRPSPVESDYFYDQYVDYPVNDTLSNALNFTHNQTSPYLDFNQNKFTLNQLPLPRPPPSSQFTFFGHPLPSLGLGNVWGAGRTANNRASSGENSTRGKGRVQIFRPGDPELEVIINRPNNDLEPTDQKNREPAASVKKPIVDSSLEKMDEKFYRPYPYFQTPFSQPKPEKGFSPMIPGMTVGGFIPIQDPVKNGTKEEVKNNKWPADDNFKEVQLVTKSESITKRTSSMSTSVGHVDKIGPSTVSHLTTSISPILSTLVPRVEIITERPNVDDQEDPEEQEEESHEIESRVPNKSDKMSFEEEIYRQNQETTQNAPSYSTAYVTSTTENGMKDNGIANFRSPPSSTTESEPFRESSENFDDVDNFNGSSSLSADHLIAPGSIISEEAPNKVPSLPGKAGKITKVFSPSPPVANSNEISKLLTPFYPQQYSSEPPTNDDNEYQPNQIYQQTFNNNERVSDAPQYERDDMEWYFKDYNQSLSNPILNYNLQPYDNFERSSANRNYFNCMRAAIVLIVIRIWM